MHNLEKIRAILEETAKPYGIFITDLIWRKSQGQNVLEIPIMFSDGTMDLETCSIMSQQFIDALEDVEDLDFEYFIDVCSPGAERVLNTYEDIEREVNHYVYVKLKNPKAGLHEISGNLSFVNKENIGIEYIVKTRKNTVEIAIDNISLIRLAVKI